MVNVKKIDIPKPEKTKLYLGTIILSFIPFVGLAFSLNGFIRSTLKVIKSKKTKQTDKRAIVGIIFSSIALLISMVAINVVLNPAPGITLTNTKTNTDGIDYVLTGKISNMESEASKLTINNIDIPLKNGEFSYKVNLKEGDNTFNLVATNHNGETKRVISIHRTTKAELAARVEAERLAAEKKQQSETSDASKPVSVTASYKYEWANDSGNSYYLLVSNFDNSVSDFKDRIKATISDFASKVSFTTNTLVLVTNNADVYKCETLTGKPNYTSQKYIDCFNQAGGKDVYNANISTGNIALYSHEQSYASNACELIFYPDASSSHEYAKYKETVSWKP